MATFFVFVVGGIVSTANAESTSCPEKDVAEAKCQAQRSTVVGKYQQVTPCTEKTYADGSHGWHFEYKNNGWIDPYVYDGKYVCSSLCASAAPFNGWMDFTGNAPLVACKENCAYAFGDGESGAIVDGGNEQRFVGTFMPLGRECNASESTASGTPAIGDPPPKEDPPDGGDGGGDGGGNGDGSGDGDGGGGDGDGGGDHGGDGGDGGDGGGDDGGDGDGGDGDGGDGDGDGGGGDGGGGNGDGGDGSGDGGDGGDGDGDGDGGSGPAPGSSSGGSSKGSYSGDSCEAPPQCTGDAVMCGVAQESHKARCALENSLVPKEATLPDGVGEDHNQSELIGPDVDVSQGVTLDQSGFGLDSTCPFGSVEYQMGDTTASFDWSSLCDSVLGLRAFIMIMATVACWRIMRGDAKASGGLI